MTVLYYLICFLLTLGILFGIAMMNRVKTAAAGNMLSGLCTAAAILFTMATQGLLYNIAIWICIVVGIVLGVLGAARIKMIQMPQAVALLNGLGGAASMLVSFVSLTLNEQRFSLLSAWLAMSIGAITLTGSLVAAAKLHTLLSTRPVLLKGHNTILLLCLAAIGLSLCAPLLLSANSGLLACVALMVIVISSLLGIIFSLRVGGADMPITISLLNSFSGVAGAIAGLAISDFLLVAVGGIVGASGLLLTQIMCRAINRPMAAILLGTGLKSDSAPACANPPVACSIQSQPSQKETVSPFTQAISYLYDAKKVMIIPGYGMAIAQAQEEVRALADKLEAHGTIVSYAIHPVAGRMPGHMNILLCEVGVPYEQLLEMDVANPLLADCTALIIGANDVVNPAANTAQNTPIYGMPILQAQQAQHVIICNYDLAPGYAGVPNPLYSSANATLLPGDAKANLTQLLSLFPASS